MLRTPDNMSPHVCDASSILSHLGAHTITPLSRQALYLTSSIRCVCIRYRCSGQTHRCRNGSDPPVPESLRGAGSKKSRWS